MTTTFSTELSLIKASLGHPIDLARIQVECLRSALEEQRVNSLRLEQHTRQLEHRSIQMKELVERRNSFLSHSKDLPSELARLGECVLGLSFSYSKVIY